ncbi:MAG: lytic transglycosylase domain-containing protein [Lachnospiraceae bacterium]|nr:lytic transglycosylase domain-containing protein [Lachnospiraceae bacterium]
MSALLVNDVTAYHTSGNTVGKTKKSSHTTITPFQKVLEKEETKVSKEPGTSSVKKSDAASTAKTGKSSGGTAETSLQDIFERAAEKYDVSYDFLVAVAKAESDFNPKCVSSAGAMGIMQLMPENCKELGVKDPYDAEQNIMAAAKLLKAHLKKFNGDITLAAAAYNAGSGAVQKYGGVPPYKETQNYVKKINKFMKEGVTVPDKKVTVSSTESSTGSGGSAGVKKSSGTASDFDTGVKASDSDWEQVTVAVGSGDNAVTMTYGAYLRYLELGTTGVG